MVLKALTLRWPGRWKGQRCCHDGTAEVNDVGLVVGDGERDGGTPAEVTSIFCLSVPLETIDRLASCFGGHRDRNLPWLVVWASVR